MREKLDIVLLYVEDDIEIREEMATYLERRVHHLIIAANGVEALHVLEHTKPNLIITDVQMSIMDGIKLIRRIKEMDPNLPIIALTAYNSSDTRLDEIMSLKISECLGKPVDPSILMRTIEKFITNVQG